MALTVPANDPGLRPVSGTPARPALPPAAPLTVPVTSATTSDSRRVAAKSGLASTLVPLYGGLRDMIRPGLSGRLRSSLTPLVDTFIRADAKLTGEHLTQLASRTSAGNPDPTASARIRDFADPLDPAVVAMVRRPAALSKLLTAGDLASLQRRVDLANSPKAQRQFAKAVAKASGNTPLVAGNTFSYHLDGKAAYDEVHRQIRGATQTLDLEYYEFHDDKDGWSFARELVDRVQHGVTVNVLLDEMHARQHQPIIDYLNAHGVTAKRFNNGHPVVTIGSFEGTLKPWDTTDHRKLLLVDGKSGMVGGMNLGTPYTRWHDSMTSVAGPIVKGMYAEFAQNWQVSGGKPPMRSLALAATQAVPVAGEGMLASLAVTRPNQEHYFGGIKAAIAQATDHIFLNMPYFCDPDLIDALSAAADRGVRVEVAIPNFADSAVFDTLHRAQVNHLLDHHIMVRFSESRSVAGVQQSADNRPFAHVKAITIDGIFSAVGSTNADGRSMHRNQELSVFVTSPGFALDLERRLFQHDIATGRSVPTGRQTLTGALAPDFAKDHPSIDTAVNGVITVGEQKWGQLAPASLKQGAKNAADTMLRFVGRKL
ncbi:MAG: hypothetical protein H7338_21785 [Candidatus Sericytochromatia bacterium]|nr:hypothetical protein [Candidatus Sericytochromatia bacterium]